MSSYIYAVLLLNSSFLLQNQATSAVYELITSSLKKAADNQWVLYCSGVLSGLLVTLGIMRLRRRSVSKNVVIDSFKLSSSVAAAKGESTLTQNKNNSVLYSNFQPKDNWIIAHASEVGLAHITASPPLPCQDSHAIKHLAENWGIAVACDGAGSARLSHKGAKFIAEEAVKLFAYIIRQHEWVEKKALPSKADWELLADRAMKKLRYDLEQYARKESVRAKDLACTVIVVVFSPIGLLLTHIGDGRAGYKDVNNQWHAILEPHKGAEANQTVFLTSNSWLNNPIMESGSKVPGSSVINDVPTAFTLMSDGCERHSFELGFFDESRQVFIAKNQPYPRFFNPLVQTLIKMRENEFTAEQINEKWAGFLKAGTERLKNEPDDKTLILGVLTDE